MKRFIVSILSIILLFALLPWEAQVQTKAADNKKLKIVTTIFPEYDWIKEILGEDADRAEVTLLMDKGVDMHSFQPTAEDIMKISTCDLFIYVGGESDQWVEDVLSTAVNPDMQVINLLQSLGDAAKEEELIEGMETERIETEEMDTEGMEAEEIEADGEESEEAEYDEHVWLSLKNAQFLVRVLAETLSEMDPDAAEHYTDHAAVYLEKLTELDDMYRTAVADSTKDTLVFGDRFPFRYLTDDYGLNYYAAFSGCSAETEASFETIIFLAEKVDELQVSSVLTIDGSDQKIAETIIANTKSRDQSILTLDSIQRTGIKDAKNGTTYLSIMKKNLDVLTDALN